MNMRSVWYDYNWRDILLILVWLTQGMPVFKNLAPS